MTLCVQPSFPHLVVQRRRLLPCDAAGVLRLHVLAQPVAQHVGQEGLERAARLLPHLGVLAGHRAQPLCEVGARGGNSTE